MSALEEAVVWRARGSCATKLCCVGPVYILYTRGGSGSLQMG